MTEPITEVDSNIWIIYVTIGIIAILFIMGLIGMFNGEETPLLEIPILDTLNDTSEQITLANDNDNV